MQKYEINAERAFQFIIRASSASNMKVRDVAAGIVARAESDFTS